MAPPKRLKRPLTLQVTLSARRGTALRRAPAKQRTKVKYPSYYTLSIASELKSDVSSTPRPLTVAVRQFEKPAYLRQGRIVYSQTPGEVGFYEYHRWAVGDRMNIDALHPHPRRRCVSQIVHAKVFNACRGASPDERHGYLSRCD
jgi:hypothetical protein